MQARAGIREIHFLPFNPVDKRTALTYIDSDGSWHRASKGAPEQVLQFFPIINYIWPKIVYIVKASILMAY